MSEFTAMVDNFGAKEQDSKVDQDSLYHGGAIGSTFPGSWQE